MAILNIRIDREVESSRPIPAPIKVQKPTDGRQAAMKTNPMINRFGVSGSPLGA